MWTFVKLVDERFEKPMEYPWLLVINTLADLLIYEMSVQQSLMSAGVLDYLRSKEYEDNVGITQRRGEHCKNSIANMLAVCHKIEGKGLMELVSDIASKSFKTRCELLKKYGKFYVQPCGSYMPPAKTHKVLKRVESEEIVFPDDKDVRYLQWPNGIHWYAKIGNTDVSVDGAQKWDSKEEAETAVKKFLGVKK